MTVGLVYDDAYLRHEHTPTHPERKERLQYTMDQLAEEGVLDDPAIEMLAPDEPSNEQLQRVHTDAYLERLRSMSASGSGMLSVDTHISAHTWETAKLAAGGVMRGMDAVASVATRTAFVMGRRGGHHASPADRRGIY